MNPHAAAVDWNLTSRHRLFWRVQIGGWLLLMPFFTGISMIAFENFKLALLIGVLRQVIGFGLTVGLWRIYRRWPVTHFSFRQHALKIVFLCMLATAADVTTSEIVRHVLGIGQLTPGVQYGSMALRFAVYAGWTALYFMLRQEIDSRETELRLARAEATNREAELQLLRAQMDPHFIFNALNTIIGEAEENPAAVIDTTHAVADYLRYSLSQTAHQAPLGDELDAMSNYLRVERSNYGAHRFVWRIEATNEARGALSPTALVQPLIENAIKYGIRSSPSPLQLRVTAEVVERQLIIAVENSGQWVGEKNGEQSHRSHGIGLQNLQRRLSLLFGEHSRFDVTTPTGFVRITVTVPFTAAPEKAPRPNSALPFQAREFRSDSAAHLVPKSSSVSRS